MIKYIFLQVDLSSKASMYRFHDEFAKQFGYYDILINNAALLSGNRGETEDGFSEIIGVNHLGVMYFTHLLLPYINTTNGRIVVTASLFHFFGNIDLNRILDHGDVGTINGLISYSNSKLMNILFVKELAHRVTKQGYKFTIIASHPGMAPTNMAPEVFNTPNWKYFYHNFAGKFFFKTAEHGAQAAISAATDPELEGVMGAYYGQCGILDTQHYQVLNETVRKVLWKESSKLLKIDEDFVEKKLKRK